MKTRKRKVENPFPFPIGDEEAAQEEAAAQETSKPRRGRPALHAAGEPMDTGIYIRCSKSQKEALKAFVDKLTEDRAEQGLSRVDVSTWLRELGLKHSGNGHLGAHAREMAKADEKAIV